MRSSLVLLAGVLPLAASGAPASPARATAISNEDKAFTAIAADFGPERVRPAAALAARLKIPDSPEKVVVLEVRPEAEFEAGHIPSAILAIKPHAVLTKVNDRTKEIWIVGDTERGAVYFAAVLAMYGYQDVYVMQGGFRSWVEQGLTLENKMIGRFRIRPAAANDR